MTFAEVQALEIGAELYYVDYDPSGRQVLAVVRPVEVFECRHNPGAKFPGRPRTGAKPYPGAPDATSVNARNCYRTRAEAHAELIRRVRETRDRLSSVLAGLASFDAEPAPAAVS